MNEPRTTRTEQPSNSPIIQGRQNSRRGKSFRRIIYATLNPHFFGLRRSGPSPGNPGNAFLHSFTKSSSELQSGQTSSAEFFRYEHLVEILHKATFLQRR